MKMCFHYIVFCANFKLTGKKKEDYNKNNSYMDKWGKKTNVDFQKMTAYLDQLHTQMIPGCGLMIYRDHELIYRHFAGHSDEEGKIPMKGDETYTIFSCTKVITTCAAMQLIEAGKIHLDDPVSDYLPAYAHLKVKDGDRVRPAKRVMTVRHLMSMQGGLNYRCDTAPMDRLLAREPMAGTREVAEAFAEIPLEFEPGTDFCYGLCHDVLAAVIEVASGQKFSEYLQEHIFQPLDMNTISFKCTPEIEKHLCAKFRYDGAQKKLVSMPAAELIYCFSPAQESGGGGLYSNMRDYALFLDAIACGGVGHTGARILLPETIQLWRANQLGPESRKTYACMGLGMAGRNSKISPARIGYSYGLGVRTRVDMNVGVKTCLGEFGWNGAAGAFALIDPHHHLSMFYAPHVMRHPTNGDIIQPTLSGLLYECMNL